MSLASLTEIAFQYWTQLDCAKSLKLCILARHGLWREVLQESVNPVDYDSAQAFLAANAAVCFLKKNPLIPGFSQKDRKQAAMETWYAGERSCYLANERLSPSVISPLNKGCFFTRFLRDTRDGLVSILGYGPSDLEVQSSARHGPGTTFASSVANPTAADKYSEVPTITRNAIWYLSDLVGTHWGDIISSRYSSSFRDCINTTRGNRHTVVPKTAKTDRSIAIEASINVYFQLAIGKCVRRRLRSAGLDLDTAATNHREMARRASVDGSFATIDLSNASDTLSRNLVKVLFEGTSWLQRFEDLRSSHSFVDGKWVLLEKFSSMGNGYTFELETAVFLGLALQCYVLHGIEPLIGVNVSCFGDDIIVVPEVVDTLTHVLRWCGFSLNEEKTFTSGPFRESCGGDFYLGHPVRGYYHKGDTIYGTQPIFTLHNGASIVLQNLGVNSPWFCSWIRSSFIPARLRAVGGSSRLGDSVLWGVAPQYRWKNQIRWVRSVSWSVPRVVPWRYFSDATRLACSLVGHTGTPSGLFSRGKHLMVRLSWVSDS